MNLEEEIHGLTASLQSQQRALEHLQSVLSVQLAATSNDDADDDDDGRDRGHWDPSPAHSPPRRAASKTTPRKPLTPDRAASPRKAHQQQQQQYHQQQHAAAATAAAFQVASQGGGTRRSAHAQSRSTSPSRSHSASLKRVPWNAHTAHDAAVSNIYSTPVEVLLTPPPAPRPIDAVTYLPMVSWDRQWENGLRSPSSLTRQQRRARSRTPPPASSPSVRAPPPAAAAAVHYPDQPLLGAARPAAALFAELQSAESVVAVRQENMRLRDRIAELEAQYQQDNVRHAGAAKVLDDVARPTRARSTGPAAAGPKKAAARGRLQERPPWNSAQSKPRVPKGK